MGCGRVGSTLAVNLSAMGHSVAVIDQDPAAFGRLPEDFPGQQVTGVGFDHDALIQAGIEDAYGFAAVSSGDNSNIIAARVVRETFGITNVVTRIYDPQRAEIYERLGIATVPTVKWTADQVLRHLIPLGPHYEYNDSAAGVSLVAVDLDEGWYGRTVSQVEAATGARVAYMTRLGDGFIPQGDTVLQDGDQVRIVAKTDDAGAAQYVLNHPVPEEYL
ncbi:MAG: TrkA family potassium uptake protein [Ancrocorticia sp.]|jgi:trk system potassium uptake protein TrkA|nr:TrkA family potassium uptake protein [Ancrocorticia sp.]MCI1895628.1 TrkA family potassium uptake protein [Ancrocorticia sp.]MCI1932365.1 TrkA family potassium uptake protein [Ancrocorticia sp.]MCI2012331.1 TrkA family potassium uptake protein [Ancrocorticia sp.]MCI2028962.1 TrkA family potassium uptake protein [Ancrocorticia sp.]